MGRCRSEEGSETDGGTVVRCTPKEWEGAHTADSTALLEDLESWRAVCPKTAKVVPIGTNCRTGLARLPERIGCKPLSRGWHGLRHTFASIFIEQVEASGVEGYAKVIRRWR